MALSIGAAQRQLNPPHRYDADVIFGGLGLKIVDHQSNMVYLYGDDKGTYRLTRSFNLTGTGHLQINYKEHGNDAAKENAKDDAPEE